MTEATRAARPVTSPKTAFSSVRFGAFVAFHLLAFAAIWTGIPRAAVFLCLAVALFQVFAVTIGYHRYFSHRAFKTSRVMQFLLAFLAQTSFQKGVLWWAGHHRYHHRHSDQADDLHSPNDGIFWSYAGWIFDASTVQTRFDQIKDFAKYPELRLLNAFPYWPGFPLAVLCYAIQGWPGVVVGFLWGNILSHHATFANNCFAHIYGTRPYETGDRSRNNWFLAAITLGEGWHNNHHRYAASARHGFMWWEIDPTYYVLRLLQAVGLIWDLRLPPKELIDQRRALRAAE
jgi:stearoyl-CoA desaturase (delta-9 desaturase)